MAQTALENGNILQGDRSGPCSGRIYRTQVAASRLMQLRFWRLGLKYPVRNTLSCRGLAEHGSFCEESSGSVCMAADPGCWLRAMVPSVVGILC